MIDDIIQSLRYGNPVCFPTDTVYALAVDPNSNPGLDVIYSIKCRDRDKPLALLADENWFYKKHKIKSIQEINKLFPGKITFLIEAGEVCNHLAANSKIGVRFPSDCISRTILTSFGGCLAATSLNLSGEPEILTYGEALRFIDDRCKILPGQVGTGKPSTVLDVTLCPPKIMRIGAVAPEELRFLLDLF